MLPLPPDGVNAYFLGKLEELFSRGFGRICGPCTWIL